MKCKTSTALPIFGAEKSQLFWGHSGKVWLSVDKKGQH